jgi:DNA-binding transcriptional regulator YdaS (Cro superfamily)
MKKPLDRAIAAAGGVGRLADAIGVKSTAVSNWKQRGVPKKQCPAIERATGVRCEEFHPNVEWQRDENGNATGYCIDIGDPLDNND